MRNISFAITPEQIRNRTKTVTRRFGWQFLEPGTLLQPVEKAMGLKKGEKVRPIGPPVRVTSVRREPAHTGTITREECRKEGFPDLTPVEFLSMLLEANGKQPGDTCTRIEFEYTGDTPSSMSSTSSTSSNTKHITSETCQVPNPFKHESASMTNIIADDLDRGKGIPPGGIKLKKKRLRKKRAKHLDWRAALFDGLAEKAAASVQLAGEMRIKRGNTL